VLAKWRGPGTPEGATEPGLNCSTPANRSGKADITAALRAQAQDDLRFQRAVGQLHRLGPRTLLELLREIGRERLISTYMEDKVGIYARLDAEILRALGGDRFPPRPLRVVRP
jgi:hypothetical protein